MNKIARSVLASYSYDSNPDDISTGNILRQSIELIARLPVMAAYGYQAKSHYHDGKSLYLHTPQPRLSTAENLLYMIRPDNKYTREEAEMLDVLLMIHAEHGGGNNSTFTTHVVTSSGTDTYSAVAAALASLKGPKHGGANVKVYYMFEDLKKHVKDWEDEDALEDYLEKLLDKQVFDKKGLIYGMGHAVYTISDPVSRFFTVLLKSLRLPKVTMMNLIFMRELKDWLRRLSAESVKIYKGVAANVDFYSGLLYSLLDIPCELYTPLFATARITGWSAHRLEELINCGKIIRPAYMSISENKEYVDLKDR